MTLSPRQWSRLRGELLYARQHIPLYRDLWARAGVDVRLLQTPEDLRRLPVLTRQHIRAADVDARLDPRYPRDRLRESSTSGSTGEPLQILLDKGAQRRRQLRFLRALWRCGYRPGQSMMLISSRSSRSIKRVSAIAPLLRWHYVDLYEGEAQLLQSFLAISPQVLYGPVSALEMLADALTRHGQLRRPPRVLISTGEQLTARACRRLETVFGTTVTDFYGLTEVGLIAWRRAGSATYEVDGSGLFLEFEPHPEIPDCEQLVVTDLVGGAMPLYRYQTGDLVHRSTGDADAAITGFLGKQLDQLRMPDGTHIGPYAVDGALMDVPGLLRYQVVQQHDFSLEALIEAGDTGVLPQAQAALERLCGGRVAVRAKPWSFERASSHKARPVTSLVSHAT